MDRSGQIFYYHQNSLWSVEAITDSMAAVVERYAYDAYGFPTILDGAGNPVPENLWGTAHSTIGNPWLFTGRQFDEETGLYFYRARYYDPVKGRFLQRDPIGYVGGVNLYEYVQSSPTNLVDPSGYLPAPDPSYSPNPCEFDCHISVKVWFIYQTLGIGRHGFIETECRGEKNTWELWEHTVPFHPEFQGESLLDANGNYSLIVHNMSLGGGPLAGGISRRGGGAVATTTVFDKTFVGCHACDCIERKSREWARDPIRPTQLVQNPRTIDRGGHARASEANEYRLLGPNSNTYLVHAMRACVDPEFSLGWGGIGGGNQFTDPTPWNQRVPYRGGHVKR
jgi:RHS repeat-associated protein